MHVPEGAGLGLATEMDGVPRCWKAMGVNGRSPLTLSPTRVDAAAVVTGPSGSLVFPSRFRGMGLQGSNFGVCDWGRLLLRFCHLAVFDPLQDRLETYSVWLFLRPMNDRWVRDVDLRHHVTCCRNTVEGVTTERGVSQDGQLSTQAWMWASLKLMRSCVDVRLFHG